MPQNSADVLVKYKANQTPPVTYQDPSGKAISKLEVHADTLITFGIAPGSDGFMFNYCYVSPNEIKPCPPPGATPANPDEFKVSPAQPFSVATVTLDDGDDVLLHDRVHADQRRPAVGRPADRQLPAVIRRAAPRRASDAVGGPLTSTPRPMLRLQALVAALGRRGEAAPLLARLDRAGYRAGAAVPR